MTLTCTDGGGLNQAMTTMQKKNVKSRGQVNGILVLSQLGCFFACQSGEQQINTENMLS